MNNFIEDFRYYVDNQGIIVYNYILSELLLNNENHIQKINLSDNDINALKRIIKKVEKQYNGGINGK